MRLLRAHDGLPVVWLSGTAASGASAVALELELLLRRRGHRVARLDEDELVRGLCEGIEREGAGLEELDRRIAHVALRFLDEGFIGVVRTTDRHAGHPPMATALMGERVCWVALHRSAETPTNDVPSPAAKVALSGANSDRGRGVVSSGPPGIDMSTMSPRAAAAAILLRLGPRAQTAAR